MCPMKDRMDACMFQTFKDVYEFLDICNCKPKLHVLDNECSRVLQTYIKKEDTRIQLVEPHNHRVNAAETAVKAAKYHIIAGLQTVDPECPPQLWGKFIPQLQDTLNLLRTARSDPTISAFEALEGTFDYNKTTMALLGMKVLAFIDPKKFH